MSMLTKIPDDSEVWLKVVVKNTFINVVPEECTDSTSPGAQSCVARLLEPSSPRIFGKLLEGSNGGDSSTTFTDDSSSRSDPGDGNYDEVDSPEIHFYDPSNYIETPMASPYMATACADLSVPSISLENLLTHPSESLLDDFTFRNISVNDFYMNLDTQIPSHLPSPPAHVAPNIMEMELTSLPPQLTHQIDTMEIDIKIISIENKTALGSSEAVVRSVGSQKHGTVTADGHPVCQPCAWFHKTNGCQSGASCEYCHVCPPGELKNRKKQKYEQKYGRFRSTKPKRSER